MTGRRAVVALSLLCALVAGALAAPNAMALKGTTANTCRPENNPQATTKGFEDEHCTKKLEGTKVKFVQAELEFEKTTQITATNNVTGGQNSTPRLEFKAEGEVVEIRAGAFTTCAEKTTVRNSLFAKQQMVAGGEFCGEFTTLEVAQPSNTCKVKGGKIALTAGVSWQSLVAEVGKEEEMSVGFLAPASETFATFDLEKCPNKALDKTYTVKGKTVFANIGKPGTIDGATLSFQTGPTGEALQIGGVPAHFDATLTARMTAEPEKETNPITLETTAF
jgi:hypothetical protein